MRLIIVIVLLAAVAYYVWHEAEPPQPPAETQQQVEPDPEGGLIEEHLLAPLNKAQDFKDDKYNKELEKHQAELDKQDQ
jgi:flagellar basal body-associated protein FliL